MYLMLESRKMDNDNKGKDKFNKCMDKSDPKSCSSINVKGNDKEFCNLKL